MKILPEEKRASTLLLVVLITLLSQTFSFCQERQNTGKKPLTDAERLKIIQEKVIKPLSLSTTQSEVVTKAFTDFFSKEQELRKTQANPKEPLEKSKIDPLEKSRDEKIRQVLSAEQFTRYRELEKSSRPAKPKEPEQGKSK